MQTSLCGILTQLLDRLCDGDHLLVDDDLLCFQRVSDVLGSYCTEDLAVLVCFYFNLDYGLSEFSLQSLSISQDLSCLVSLLFEVLSQLLTVALVCDDSNLLRQQVVASVAVTYFNDVVLETQISQVLNKNYFHVLSFLL